MKNIAIVTTGHSPYDERIYHKFGLSFSENNYITEIICSTEECKSENNEIKITGFRKTNLSKRGKIIKLSDILLTVHPDIIICCEPIAIIIRGIAVIPR
jgi:hypothetical protein